MNEENGWLTGIEGHSNKTYLCWYTVKEKVPILVCFYLMAFFFFWKKSQHCCIRWAPNSWRRLKFSVIEKEATYTGGPHLKRWFLTLVLVNTPANSFAFHHFYNCNALQDSIRSANNSVNGFSAILVFAGISSVKFRFRSEFRLDIEIRFLPEPD